MKKRMLRLAALTLMAGAAVTVYGDITSWTGEGQGLRPDWSVAANWSGSSPDQYDTAYVNDTSSCTTYTAEELCDCPAN